MHTGQDHQLFDRAREAYAAGRLKEAREHLTSLTRRGAVEAPVLHLLALVEKRRGDREAAHQAFTAALSLAPADPEIRTNFANLLGELGQLQAALEQYDTALASDARFRPARMNRALLLQRMGEVERALTELDALAAAGAGDAKLHSARGSALLKLDRVDAAADAFDRALAIDPRRLVALHGRARVAMERGEADAVDRYIAALRQKPGDLELVLGVTEALEAEGDPGGIETLRQVVAGNPGWVLGHDVLARMRAEAGEADSFADHYEASLRQRPRDAALHRSYWEALARAERHADALAALRRAKAAIGADEPMLRAEAALAGEAGEPRGGLALLEGLTSVDWDVLFVRGRLLLQCGEPAAAAEPLQRLVEQHPASIAGWAHLDLCWRLLGDGRHQWLSCQPGLHGARDIGLAQAELGRLGELLRGLHRTRAHPIGQSLRGGTQTRGRLFWRQEPELRRLREAIVAAVDDHVRALPPKDEGHPLLRHRNASLALGGSWSVRLLSNGFHVSHIHPEGVLSSACYISLPARLGEDGSKAGWLEIGRPPPAVGADLGPLAEVEPAPGRLALFPSYMFHGTRPFDEGERLTVAFDVLAR
ncbi:MAG TPA: putative 2OG-Fe(II) oxygenase [Sphingomicrobium sp.]|nr:putative 2OG-Fe(II) oxygenase [Sphingomicrobium sp.]